LLVAFIVAAGAADAAGEPAKAATAQTAARAARSLVVRVARVIGILVSRAPNSGMQNVRGEQPSRVSLPNGGVLAVWPM
jgi:hypothetical protein